MLVWYRHGKQHPEVKWIGAFILTFSTIQLVDAIIWWSIAKRNHKVNLWASRFLLPTVLVSELLVAYYGGRQWGNLPSQPWYEVCLWISVFLMLMGWVISCQRTSYPNPERGYYLLWCGQDLIAKSGRIMFLFFLLFPFAIGLPCGILRDLVLLGGVATFCLNFNHPDFGAGWCWTANAMSLLFLLAMEQDVLANSEKEIQCENADLKQSVIE